MDLLVCVGSSTTVGDAICLIDPPSSLASRTITARVGSPSTRVFKSVQTDRHKSEYRGYTCHVSPNISQQPIIKFWRERERELEREGELEREREAHSDRRTNRNESEYRGHALHVLANASLQSIIKFGEREGER